MTPQNLNLLFPFFTYRAKCDLNKLIPRSKLWIVILKGLVAIKFYYMSLLLLLLLWLLLLF
jgi:hypothetical protein